MNMACCTSFSLDRPLVYLLCPVFVGTSGCGKSDEKPQDAFGSITPGMTVAEVEQILGPGKEVSSEELPATYRIVLDAPEVRTTSAKGVGVIYRKWSRGAGETIAIGYIAFRDDKVIEQTVYVEITRTEKK
jgi:hypothetical protein